MFLEDIGFFFHTSQTHKEKLSINLCVVFVFVVEMDFVSTSNYFCDG